MFPPVVTPVSVLAGGQLLCGGAKAETEKLRSSVSQQRAATRHTGHQPGRAEFMKQKTVRTFKTQTQFQLRMTTS